MKIIKKASDGPGAVVAALEVNATAVASRLAEALRFRTISHPDPADDDVSVWFALHRWMEETYPAVHRVLKREIVNERSLLYTWEGREPDAEPVILLAHQDVVPVEPGSEGKWTEPPFDGVISDGYVWGRGALDMKGPLVAILEAVELRAAAGHQPRQTIMLGFGHDEEVLGGNGATRIAGLLASRGVRLKWVFDEGGALAQGFFPGVAPPCASVGIAEKGYVTLEITATAEGGHSSMPPPDTAVTLLARAITRVHESPFPGKIDGPMAAMMDALGPEFPFPMRAVIANRWLLGPLLCRALSAKPATNAMLRTTIAPTMLEGSPKDNVLPIEAKARINFRIHPRDTVDGVVEHVTAAIDDPAISVKTVPGAHNPSAISSVSSEGYCTIERTIREFCPEAIVAPSLVVATTDSRHFSELAEDVYRFTPFLVRPEDTERIHGTNERVSVANLADAVHFYHRLLDNA